MAMEASSEPQQHSHYHHRGQVTSAVAVSNTMSNSFLASHHYNGDFLSVVPLKSDGSLCIMDSINTSQPQGFVSFYFCLKLYCDEAVLK